MRRKENGLSGRCMRQNLADTIKGGKIMDEYTGEKMWREYIDLYGEKEARGICNRYLDMQARIPLDENPEEYKFCCELYRAMRRN